MLLQLRRYNTTADDSAATALPENEFKTEGGRAYLQLPAEASLRQLANLSLP